MSSPSSTEVAKQPFNWKDPLNRLIWQKAFKARAKSMVLRDGKTYIIEYMKPQIDPVTSLPVTKAWVKIADGVAPCGWFTVETVLDPSWVRSA